MEEDENVCDICNEDFDTDKFEPRKLPCCHTYCLQCLEKLISPTTTITCPNDRSLHQLGHLGVFGLPVDTSKLPDANSRRSQTPDDSVVFSSDFINPSRPSTSRSNFSRAQNHMDVVHPGIEANPRMQNTALQQMHANNFNCPPYGFQHFNYPPYIHQYQSLHYQPPRNYSHHQGFQAPHGWYSPFQWSNHFINPPYQHQFVTNTMQTTVTQFGGGQDISIHGPTGSVQIKNTGNNKFLNIVHKF